MLIYCPISLQILALNFARLQRNIIS
ncbi:hypothetical protein ACFX2A_026090 [Malus domestica]